MKHRFTLCLLSCVIAFGALAASPAVDQVDTDTHPAFVDRPDSNVDGVALAYVVNVSEPSDVHVEPLPKQFAPVAIDERHDQATSAQPVQEAPADPTGRTADAVTTRSAFESFAWPVREVPASGSWIAQAG